MTKSIKELFEDYKKSPRNDWIPPYRARAEQVAQLRDLPATDISDELLREIWLDKSNGVASVGQGLMYRKEYKELEDNLPDLTKSIVDDPSPKKLDEIFEWFKTAQNE